jgi:hypothetical protein
MRGLHVAPRWLTGTGRLAALLGWVVATALLLAAGTLVTDPGRSQAGGLGVLVVACWCGFWVSLPLRDWLAQRPRLSRP